MNQKGITLLLTIIISFIVIALGLSISQITVRELDISATVRESMKATYAADSGIECAAYWALQGDVYFPESGTSEDIECGGNTVNVSSLGAGSHSFSFDTNGSKASAIVTRSTDIDGNELITLSSTGLSSVSGARIVEAFREYEIRAVSSGSATGIKADVFITLDVSGSLGGSRSDNPPIPCDQPGSSQIDCAMSSSKDFVETLLSPGNDVLVGHNSFHARIRVCDIGDSDGDGDYGPENCGDERNDVLLTDNTSFFDFLFSSKENFSTDNPNYYGPSGSNYHVAAEFAHAELTGMEIIPKSESPRGFRTFRTPADGGRDRNDSIYPDYYIAIGDFEANAYHGSDWRICEREVRGGWCDFSGQITRGSNPTGAHYKAAQVYKRMNRDGIQVFLISVGGMDFQMQQALSREGVSYTHYNAPNYEGLEEAFNLVLANFGATVVTPIIEK